jgi:hypothetical protein
MDRKMECPICKKKAVFVGVHDDEGNYHGLMGCEYENAPWSGLSYALHHEGWGDCPLCTDDAESTMGGMLFDTAEEAISALSPPNKPLTLEELREMDGEPAWWDDGDGSCWGIISVDSAGMWGGIPFFRGRWKEVNFEYNIEDRKMKIYRRPPEGEEDA